MPVSRFFGTFGVGQYAGLLANSFVEIHVDPSEVRPGESALLVARRVMSEAFDSKWSGVYDEQTWISEDIERRFSYVRLGVLDSYGNVLQRGPSRDPLREL